MCSWQGSLCSGFTESICNCVRKVCVSVYVLVKAQGLVCTLNACMYLLLFAGDVTVVYLP